MSTMNYGAFYSPRAPSRAGGRHAVRVAGLGLGTQRRSGHAEGGRGPMTEAEWLACDECEKTRAFLFCGRTEYRIRCGPPDPEEQELYTRKPRFPGVSDRKLR